MVVGPVSLIPAREPEEKKTRVQVAVEWPSRTKVNTLHEGLESLGKMLCRGTFLSDFFFEVRGGCTQAMPSEIGFPMTLTSGAFVNQKHNKQTSHELQNNLDSSCISFCTASGKREV